MSLAISNKTIALLSKFVYRKVKYNTPLSVYYNTNLLKTKIVMRVQFKSKMTIQLRSIINRLIIL